MRPNRHKIAAVFAAAQCTLFLVALWTVANTFYSPGQSSPGDQAAAIEASSHHLAQFWRIGFAAMAALAALSYLIVAYWLPRLVAGQGSRPKHGSSQNANPPAATAEPFQALAETSDALGFILSDERAPRYVSPSAHQLLGLSGSAGMAQCDLASVFGKVGAAQLGDLLDHAEQTPNKTCGPEVLTLESAGAEVLISITAAHVPDLNGFVLSGRDVTTVYQLEEQMRQRAELEAVSNLNATSIHDLNNQLAVALGYLDLMTDMDLPEQIAGFVTKSLGALQSGAELTAGIQFLSRRARSAPQSVNLNTLIDKVKVARAPMPCHDIEWINTFAPDLLTTRADPKTAHTAIVNLLRNACKAMPNGGVLNISTQNTTVAKSDGQILGGELCAGRYALVEVFYGGAGLTDEQVSHLFDPFLPANEGKDLSWALIDNFMMRSGGAIRVLPTPGKGATVRLFFPAEDK